MTVNDKIIYTGAFDYWLYKASNNLSKKAFIGIVLKSI
jgi:hypothetical protein